MVVLLTKDKSTNLSDKNAEIKEPKHYSMYNMYVYT